MRIHGLTVKPTDDCCHVVLSLLREKLDITNVNAVDIEAAHVLPTRPDKQPEGASAFEPGITTSPRSQPVIVRFRSRQLRDEVVRKRRKLKGSGFTIVEDLTALNTKTLNLSLIHI